ncbi:ABC transporter ATP-binding protein [Psychroflexus sp. YR1-1]|uniref:ABC transporter ATP-binding protein n=1 Tax=Psychroflexus aurantiacus TaxID=2709310 RepID=A0A6B3R7C3_9FLAO|nr:ABC transporter ATP-binding protein [Psychroflexus aurantiacus]NEV93701.1 ABC transporter ATP-binding protein [Psychroflexus aurantiacus]
MVEFKDIHKKFGKNEVLSGINLKIQKGKTTAILGPNGSGKTTLIKILLGMNHANSGEILVNNTSIRNNWSYRKNMDYLPQIANFPGNIKVKEIIAMMKDLRQQTARDKELTAYFELKPYLNTNLSHLSGGYKQKVNLVLSLMFDSPFIILDEPTSGLDPLSLIKLKELLKKEQEQGKTILITSHIMSFVEEISDHISFILDGKVYFDGSIGELKSTTGKANFEYAIANLLKTNHA